MELQPLERKNKENLRNIESLAYGKMDKDGVLRMESEEDPAVLGEANTMVAKVQKDYEDLLKRQLAGEKGLEQQIHMAKTVLESEEEKRAGKLPH